MRNRAKLSLKKIFFSLLKTIRNVASGKGFGKVPGVKKVYGFLFIQLKPTIVFVQGNMMHINPQDRGVGVHLLMKGVYEEYATELFRKMIKKGMIVVDMGAHIGYYTLMSARLVGDEGKIYAFEPYPPSYKLLVKNIQVNGYRNVIPVQKALSNKKGKVTLFLDQRVSGNNSLSRDNVPDLANSIQIESITLDEYFEKDVKNLKVDFIKMDTQGAEGLVLQGMTKIIEKNNNLKILMEFWPFGLRNMGEDPQKLLNKLKQYGFQLQRIDEQKQSIENVEVNKLMELCAETSLGYTNLLLGKCAREYDPNGRSEHI